MVTEQQIDELIDFCATHHVQYYDVKMELVDHLAESIDAEMSKNPFITFEAARDKAFLGFGYKGFEGVVTAREKEMAASYHRELWQMYRSYFTWPKATFTLMLAVILYSLQFYCNPNELKWIIASASFLLMGEDIGAWLLARRPAIRRDKPLLMLKSARAIYFPSAIFLQGFINLLNFSGLKHRLYTPHSPIYDSFVLVFTGVTLLVLATQNVRKKINYKAGSLYPEAFAG